jgi:hypothetical protein
MARGSGAVITRQADSGYICGSTLPAGRVPHDRIEHPMTGGDISAGRWRL